MKVAVLYARVSSVAQDVDLSISAQLKALREYAAKNGYQVVREFVDEAESGKTTDRPAFMQMTTMARRPDKPFDTILVWKFSRFARSRHDSIVFKTMLKKNGVKVVSINEPSSDSPTGKLFEAMVESLDEFYSANLGEEITRGLRESASRGFCVGSVTPYGYRRVMVKDGNKVRPKLEPEPFRSKVVQRIFKEVLEGRGLKEITAQLNADGVAGPTNKGWSKTTVFKVIANEAYTGTLVWGVNTSRDQLPIRVENAWTAIVDKETFSRSHALLTERAPEKMHPKRVGSRYLLSGLAKCGHCGKALVGQSAKGGKYDYYVCSTMLKKGVKLCPSSYINTIRFEGLVLEKIKQQILTPENIEDLVRLINADIESNCVEAKQQLETTASELGDTQSRLGRLFEALETGKVSLDDLSPRIKELRLRKDKLLQTKADLENRIAEQRIESIDSETLGWYVQELAGLLDEGSLAERRAFLKSFIKEARVTDNEVLMTYTMPVMPDGTNQEKAVLDTVNCGGAEGTRTPYLFNAIEALSQLSYSPTRLQYSRGPVLAQETAWRRARHPLGLLHISAEAEV